ncbi:MAG: hypothetical protein ACFFAS_07105 [Promethearchaeota archaeon]
MPEKTADGWKIFHILTIGINGSGWNEISGWLNNELKSYRLKKQKEFEEWYEEYKHRCLMEPYIKVYISFELETLTAGDLLEQGPENCSLTGIDGLWYTLDGKREKFRNNLDILTQIRDKYDDLLKNIPAIYLITKLGQGPFITKEELLKNLIKLKMDPYMKELEETYPSSILEMIHVSSTTINRAFDFMAKKSVFYYTVKQINPKK